MGKKFVVMTLLLASILFMIFSYLVFNCKMYYMNQEYPMWVHVKETIHLHSKRKENLIIIGDSRAKAGFIPTINPKVNTLNLAVGGGTPIEGYFILKKYLQNNTSPDKIIISYAPNHLEIQDVYWERSVKFDFLSTQEYQEVEANAKEINDSTTLGLSKTYKDYWNPTKYTTDFKNGLITMRWKQNKKMLNDGFASKGHYFFGTANSADGLNAEGHEKIFKHSLLLDLYLRKLLNLAKTNNIKVYYYTMPFNQASYQASKIEYRDGYKNYMQKFAHDYKVHICNNLSYMTNDNFGDSSHLYKGAEKVSHDILNCVDDGNISVE
jgi:hypothetical protein